MKIDQVKEIWNGHRNLGNKALALMLACCLLMGGVVGGTVAWLTAKTDPVVNTFTESGINITLNETKPENKTAKMIPGWTIEKDPKVVVETGSEDCYLFVKIEGENASISQNSNGTYSLGDYIVYAVDASWKVLDADQYPNVFYKVVDGNGQGDAKPHYILGAGSYQDPMGTQSDDADDVTVNWVANQVATKPSVTKEMMATVTSENQPKLSFTAYAVQLWKTNKSADDPQTSDVNEAQFTAQQAWQRSPAAGNN